MSKKIVIIDDNFSIRHSIKAYLTSLAKKYQLDLSVFSTDNGVEGLGYIYITSPDIIVIDTTLPKYSGRAIVEFLSQNPRFQSDKVKVIILQEKLEKDLVVPSNFISINKNKKKSFDDLVKVFSNLLEISDELNSKSFFRSLVGKIYINANKVDLLGKSFRKKRLIPKLLNKLKKFVYSILTKVILALLVMIYGSPEEENITQLNIDKNAFRRHYYPTLIATFLFSGFLLTNLAIFGLTQLGLYNQNKEDAKALVTLTVDSTLDDADSDPGDGVCDTNDGVGDGPCTLRAAIEEANTEVDSVVIDFALPTYINSTTNVSDKLPALEGTLSSSSGRILVDSTGNFITVWQEANGARGNSDIYIFDSSLPDSSSNPLNLSDQLQAGEGLSNATLENNAIIDNNDNVVVAWSENDGSQGSSDTFVYTTENAISATNPLNLSAQLPGLEGSSFVNAVSLAYDSVGNHYVAWTEDPGVGDADAYLYDSSQALSSSNPLNLSNELGAGEQIGGTTYASWIKTYVNADNVVYVAWAQRGGSRGLYDMYLYRSDQALVDDVNPVNLSAQLPGTEGDNDVFGDFEGVFDINNDLVLAWVEASEPSDQSDLYLYYSGSAFSGNNPYNVSENLKPAEAVESAVLGTRSIDISDDGTIFVAWFESTGLRGFSDFYLYRDDQVVSSTNPLNLSEQLQPGEGTTQGISYIDVQVKAYGTNNAFVSWSEPTGIKGLDDIYLFDSADSISISNPLNLSNQLGVSEGTNRNIGQIGLGERNGKALVTWAEGVGIQGNYDAYYFDENKVVSSENPMNLSATLGISEGSGSPGVYGPYLLVDIDSVYVAWDEDTGLQGGRDRYVFQETDIGSSGYSIAPNSNLPDITKSDVTIDASTQSGADCATSTVKVRLSGENLISNKRGFIVDAENVSIKGFSIVDFAESGGYGIQINPSQSATILCNIVGLEIDGTTVNPNYTGVMVESTGSVNIGDGTVSGRNIISGNDSYGVGTSTWAYVNIKGNYIGTDKTGLLSKGNLNGILLGTLTTGINVIGGASGLDPDNGCSGDCNLISGNTISGISFSGFEPGDNGDGTDRLNILGNFIGTNVTGTGSIPNGSGIQNYYADSVNIGGTDISSRNVISGNSGSGMTIYSYLTQEGQQVKDLHIRNNYIGTNASGTSALPNGNSGIYMINNMPEAFVTGNVISGNNGDGIETLFDYTDVPVDSIVINDNKIGTQADGSGSIGNQDNGILLLGKGNVYIGDTGVGNIINNNGQNGIKLNDPIPPGPAVPQSSIIVSVKDNTIHNNVGSGIVIHNSGSLIQDNYILNNISSSGIEYYWGTSLDIIGNNFTGQGTGILLYSQPLIPGSNAEGANIFQNINTSHPAIDLEYRTSNDVGDSDFGENNLQNYPVLTSAEVYTDTRLFGTFNSEANTYYRIEAFGFSSLPLSEPIVESTIGSTIIQTDGSGNYDFSVNPIIIAELLSNDDNITATATKCNDSLCSDPIETSELSDGVVATILTPTPTLTPLPTDTPEPTATDTPEPTPTNTPLPTPTETPSPTSTPTPTPAPPNAPSSLGPAMLEGGGYTNDTTPTLDFTLSAPDTGMPLSYRIQILQDAVVIIDYTSEEAIQGVRYFTVGQAPGLGTYNNGDGFEGQTLIEDGYSWRVMAMGSSGDSTWTDANNSNVAFTVDLQSPTGGSISYTDGYHTFTSVPLVLDDGTDSGGINTSTRLVERSGATLSSDVCSSFGSFEVVTPTGTYPNLTDNSVTAANCYQYRYTLSDNAGNEVTYTSANVAKIDVDAPSAPGVPQTETPTFSVIQQWTWDAAVDVVSGIAQYAWRVVDEFDNTIDSGVTNTLDATTNLGVGVYTFFVSALNNAGLLSDESFANITVEPTPTNTPIPTATDTPEPTPTNTPIPTATDTPEPTPTDTPIPGPTDTPVPGATNTPIPTATNTPVPTATNTPVPTATSTLVPTATNTPLPTNTNTPIPNATNAVVPSTIPTSAVIIPSTTSVTPTLSAIPSEVIFTQTPTTNPTEVFQSPTPSEVVPTSDEKTFFSEFPPANSFTPPDESVVNHPIVKSVAKNITIKLDELTTSSSPIVPIVEAPLLIAEAIKPLTDNFNYYLSLRFIGENVALAGISTTNVLAYVAPAVVTAFSQPRVLFHALAWFWKRKRKHNWGIVLDNSNNAPVAFARIIVTKEGKTIATATTDLEGKYGFVLDKGVYQIYINHSDYVDYLKDIIVRYDAEVLAQDIELTPKLQTDFDTSIGWLYFRFKRFISQNLFIFNTLIFSIGFVYTIFAITNAMTVLNYAILTLYLFQILLMIVFYLFREKDLGQVLDSQTGEPLAGAIIRIFNNERQLDVAITDIQGRYSIYLEPGEYYLKVNFAGYVFPTANATNVVTNKTGEKLFKFDVQESEKLNIKLYMQRFANTNVSRQALLSPFS
jgi:CSLREA domain-containing protein